MNGNQNQNQQSNQVEVFRGELGKMSSQFKAALPAQIPVERFVRVLMTAVQNNPKLMSECDRRSFWNAAMKASQDGLLPDGREGAIVIRNKHAQWQPMIAGLRKKVRNSGEIETWDTSVVYAGDHFKHRKGDDPKIEHEPVLDNPGPVIGAYSIAVLKSGEKSREVMSVADINKIRDRSDAWRAFKAGKITATPWSTDYEEMCRKTVARRHSKSLPMSTDLDDLLRRAADDNDDGDGEAQAAQERMPGQPAAKIGLEARLDALAGMAAADVEEVKAIEHQGGGGGASLPRTADEADEAMDNGRNTGGKGMPQHGRMVDPKDEIREQYAKQMEADAAKPKIDERLDPATGVPNFLLRKQPSRAPDKSLFDRLVQEIAAMVAAENEISGLAELWAQRIDPLRKQQLEPEHMEKILKLFEDRRKQIEGVDDDGVVTEGGSGDE